MNLLPPVDESRYGLLCEVGVPLVPSISPQMFAEHGRSTLGAKFQYQGLLGALHELATAVAECTSLCERFPPRRESPRVIADSGSGASERSRTPRPEGCSR